MLSARRDRRCSCSASSRARSGAGPTRSRSARSIGGVALHRGVRARRAAQRRRRCSTRGCSAIAGFATGSASLFLQFFAMFGFFFVSLQFLQLVLGYSTLTAAVALLPMAALILPLSACRRDARRSGSGTSSSAAPASRSRPSGFGMFATLGTDSGYWPFLVATLVIGAGAALAMTPATNAIVASLPRAKQGVASAVNDTARELGAAFGVAVLGQRVQHRLPPRHRRPPRCPARPSRRRRRAKPRRSRCSSPSAAARRFGARARGGAGVRHRHALRRCSLGVGLLMVGARLRVVPRHVRHRRRARRRPRARGGPDPRILTRTSERARRRACRVSRNSAASSGATGATRAVVAAGAASRPRARPTCCSSCSTTSASRSSAATAPTSRRRTSTGSPPAACGSRTSTPTALCSPTRCVPAHRPQPPPQRHGPGRRPRDRASPATAGDIPRANGFLSEILRAPGYATYAVGKWHLTPDDETHMAGDRSTWPLGPRVRPLVRLPRRRDAPVRARRSTATTTRSSRRARSTRATT